MAPMIRYLLLIFLGLNFFSTSCKKGAVSPLMVFDTIPVVHHLSPVIDEVSGIAASSSVPGHIWAHEDSGNPSQLYLIKNDGTVVKQVQLKGLLNRDWEEMARCGSKIYIAETGDNGLAYTKYAFYIFNEPGAAADSVTMIDTLSFTYPDGPHNAEAFIVDSLTKDIYIFTKNDIPARIYKLGYPYSANMVAVQVGSLPFAGVTSAAISPDGMEILIRTYTNVYLYRGVPPVSIPQVLQGGYVQPVIRPENQGEAVCFAADGSGFFTLSEKGGGTTTPLYFYRRL